MPARYATPADWTAILPEFIPVGDPILQVWLDVAQDMIPISWWGVKALNGHIFLAAHLYTVANPTGVGGSGGESGPVKTREIDKLRIEYESAGSGSSTVDPLLGATKYGRLFIVLRMSLLVLPIVGRRDLLPVGGGI